jgi:2-iminoacetate synthase ThiH
MQQALKECLQGKLLEPSEALALCKASADESQDLLATAAQLRDLHKGRVVTFSPKVFCR